MQNLWRRLLICTQQASQIYPSCESLPRTKTALKQGQILALECPNSAGCWGSAWKGSRNSASHIAPQQADTANERQDGSDDAAKYQEEGMQQFEALWQSRRRAIGVSNRPEEPPMEQQKVLQTAILGCPNAGKSTLTNRLAGFKVSAVSNKTNTTNTPSFGAWTEGVTQLVLHDTPGVVDSRHYRGVKHQSRVLSAFSLARECDMLLLLVDAFRQASQPDPRVETLVSTLHNSDRLGSDPPPVVLLLNKVDKFADHERAASLRLLERKLRSHIDFDSTFNISAARGDGVSELKEYLISKATLAHWIIDPEDRTSKPVAEVIAEVVREKLYRRLHKELPYKLAIKLTQSEILRDGSPLFHFTILCPSEASRRIVVGQKGCVIGEVGITARKELQTLLKTKLHLYLKVAVKS